VEKVAVKKQYSHFTRQKPPIPGRLFWIFLKKKKQKKHEFSAVHSHSPAA